MPIRLIISGVLLAAVALCVVTYGKTETAAGNSPLTPLPTQVGCAQLPHSEPSGCTFLALPVRGPALGGAGVLPGGAVAMAMTSARADRGPADGRCVGSLHLGVTFRNTSNYPAALPPDGVSVTWPGGLVTPPDSYWYAGAWGEAGQTQNVDPYENTPPIRLHPGQSIEVWTSYDDVPVRAGTMFRVAWVNLQAEVLHPDRVVRPMTQAVYRVTVAGRPAC
jgi:hypothetical protein